MVMNFASIQDITVNEPSTLELTICSANRGKHGISLCDLKTVPVDANTTSIWRIAQCSRSLTVCQKALSDLV